MGGSECPGGWVDLGRGAVARGGASSTEPIGERNRQPIVYWTYPAAVTGATGSSANVLQDRPSYGVVLIGNPKVGETVLCEDHPESSASVSV